MSKQIFKETRIIMGMPVTIQIVDGSLHSDRARLGVMERAFEYFLYVDQKFSTYKADSEISKINSGELQLADASEDMRIVFKLAEQTKNETNGYFDIVDRAGKYDPSGIVKGWAIDNVARLIHDAGFPDHYVEAGGDIQVGGLSDTDLKWSIGIKNPFNQTENVKVVQLSDQGIATSGTYIRGQHIYDPHDRNTKFDDIISLTVIGPNIYVADLFATTAFAMGRKGIEYIEGSRNSDVAECDQLEAYMIDSRGVATMTSGFEKYTCPDS